MSVSKESIQALFRSNIQRVTTNKELCKRHPYICAYAKNETHLQKMVDFCIQRVDAGTTDTMNVLGQLENHLSTND